MTVERGTRPPWDRDDDEAVRREARDRGAQQSDRIVDVFEYLAAHGDIRPPDDLWRHGHRGQQVGLEEPCPWNLRRGATEAFVTEVQAGELGAPEVFRERLEEVALATPDVDDPSGARRLPERPRDQ